MPGDATYARDPEQFPPGRWLVLAVITSVLLPVVIDTTALHVAAPALADDLRPSAVEFLWIIDTYSLIVAPLLVLVATIADRFGRKRTMLSGLVFFTLASLMAAFAWSPGALIAARALQGVGGAMILPPTMAIIRDVFPDRDERARAIGVWSAVMAGGAAAGPIVGGLLIEHFWWGAVFLINVPILLLVLPAALRVLPESRHSNPPAWDPLSVVLVGGGILLLIYGIKESARYGITEPANLACLLAAPVLLTLFARRQLARENPTLDLRLFSRPAFRVAVGCVVLTMFALVGLDLFFAQYFQSVLGLGPAAASVRLIPLLVAALAGGLSAAWFITRFGTRVVLGGGLVACALSLVPMLAVGTADDYLLLVIPFVVLGASIEIALVAANDVIFATATEDSSAQASAIEETAYELGGGVGVAVLGSIMAAVYTSGVAIPATLGAQATDSARESISEAFVVADGLPGPISTELINAARAAFMDGFHAIIIVAILLIGASAAYAIAVLEGGRGGEGDEGANDEGAAEQTDEPMFDRPRVKYPRRDSNPRPSA